MKVRITNAHGNADGVPDDPRFVKFPPHQATLDYFGASHVSWATNRYTRVYMELTSPDDLVELNNAYGPLGICRFQGIVGDDADDGGLEVQLDVDI